MARYFYKCKGYVRQYSTVLRESNAFRQLKRFTSEHFCLPMESESFLTSTMLPGVFRHYEQHRRQLFRNRSQPPNSRSWATSYLRSNMLNPNSSIWRRHGLLMASKSCSRSRTPRTWIPKSVRPAGFSGPSGTRLMWLDVNLLLLRNLRVSPNFLGLCPRDRLCWAKEFFGICQLECNLWCLIFLSVYLARLQ